MPVLCACYVSVIITRIKITARTTIIMIIMMMMMMIIIIIINY